jgi:hypothetical protein
MIYLRDEPSRVIYFASSPIPMNGYTLMIPDRHVQHVDVDVKTSIQDSRLTGHAGFPSVPSKYQFHRASTLRSEGSLPVAGALVLQFGQWQRVPQNIPVLLPRSALWVTLLHRHAEQPANE